MDRPDFDHVWDAIMYLSPLEWRRIRRLVDALLVNGKPVKPEELLDYALLKQGVISRIPPPVPDVNSPNEFKPVRIECKPISETIIEERR